MLNSNALAELSKLKQIIEDNKDGGEGFVRGSQGRYGFVNLDDGRSVYLSADEMQRVLPGDRVLVEVITNDKNKLEAKLEKLLQKNFKVFAGTYTVKGNAHFVIPSHRETNRGLFVPPKERKKFTQGDFVQCQVSRHPFADGKSQVKILNAIGKRDDKGIEHRFIEYKHNLNHVFTDDDEKQAQEIQQGSIESISEGYTDLSQLVFVTIDSASTEDLDDALFAETDNENGNWVLYSAIADPSAYIMQESRLDNSAKKRSSSVYFPGHAIPMFPGSLTKDTLSLAPQKLRPSLVCKMRISSDGKIIHWEFIQAIIKSHAKLSYENVRRFLDGEDLESIDESLRPNLTLLDQIATARNTYRQEHNIVQNDNTDYHYQLDNNLQIESVSIRKSGSANRIVEEAMLATNHCAGQTLSDKNIKGALHSTHPGFRTERIQEITQLLSLEKPDYDSSDIETFEGFQRLMKTLSTSPDDHQLLSTLKRLLKAASLSNEPNPHFGLGFKHYALISSPIRRYQDLHNQRLIKKSIGQSNIKTGTVEPQMFQETIGTIRTAQRELTQRLLCRFLENKIGESFEAKIVAVSSQGLALRLVENGAESFVQIRKKPSKTVKYDSIRLTLTVDDSCYKVEQTINVKLEKVDTFKYQLDFSLS